MSQPSLDPSIHAEPHLQDRPFEADSSESRIEQRLSREATQDSADDAVEHTVWDEVALSPERRGRRRRDGGLVGAVICEITTD
jgi:hypothetical protein